jgi:PPOX class probable F420-dependent enzyme
MMSTENTAQFKGQTYLNLETFRKSGLGVRTPVWFVEQDGILYVRTIDGSGKVKRIRRNSQVRVAPCKVDGTLLGEWVDGRARLVDEQTARMVNRLLRRKYGLQKMLFDVMGLVRKRQPATIEIRLDNATLA